MRRDQYSVSTPQAVYEGDTRFGAGRVQWLAHQG